MYFDIFFISLTKNIQAGDNKLVTLSENKVLKKLECNQKFGGSLSGGFWAGPAQSKVVKMKKKKLPTGLQVHLEDMFWV